MNSNCDKRRGTALNIDPDALAYMYRQYVGSEVDTARDGGFTDGIRDKLVRWYRDRYADSGISDILYNISFDESAERYERRVEILEDGSAAEVDYSSNMLARASYLIKKNTDTDPYEVWFEECRRDGVNVWLSFRMNDVHCAHERTGHDEFFYTAKRNGWLIGNARYDYIVGNISTRGSRLWIPNALDYTHAEVRQHFLDIIDRQLGKYDVYGIELDWQRTIWCFPTDSLDNIRYMDIFMNDVNAIVAKHSQRYGHKIKIMARINRDIDENRYFGFDVRSWAKKGMIDVVCPAGYWGATDTAMPISAWKKELAEFPDVQIWAGLECHVMINSQWQSKETLAGQTAAYLSAGADKIYLYNLFNDVKEKFEVCSSLESALASGRSYVVTRANTTPDCAECREYNPLPVSVAAGEKSREVAVEYGVLDGAHDTVLYIGAVVDGESMPCPDVFCNGTACECLGGSDEAYIGKADNYGTVLKYLVPRAALEGAHTAVVSFCSGVPLEIKYIELAN